MPSVELTPEKLAELRQKAEAAEREEPSPWMPATDFTDRLENVVRSGNACVCSTIDPETRDYIAEADPATVLAMVEEIERLRALQCWVIMREDNRDQVFDGPFFTEEEARLHVPDSLDYEYTVEPWVNQANVKESEAQDG